MSKNRVSIKDIAERLNISKTTVSFILNGKAKERRISDKLVARVLEVVEEMGYQPNLLAKGLRTGKTRIIGLIVEDISDPFFAAIAKYVEDEALRQGYKMIYCSTENDDDRAREYLQTFRNLGVDGYIITPTPGILEELRSMADQGDTFLLFDRYFEDLSTDCVVVDNRAGTLAGTQHLIEQGFHKIGFFTIASRQSQMQHRLDGYLQAMQAAGLEERLFTLPYFKDFNQYAPEISKCLNGTIHELEAIIFSTNYLGVYGLEALVGMQVAIPGELAVLCFDDNDFFRMFTPTISVISQPLEELARKTIERLLRQMDKNEKSGEAEKIVLPAELRIRESTRRI